jgi:hypothetical protein
VGEGGDADALKSALPVNVKALESWNERAARWGGSLFGRGQLGAI